MPVWGRCRSPTARHFRALRKPPRCRDGWGSAASFLLGVGEDANRLSRPIHRGQTGADGTGLVDRGGGQHQLVGRADTAGAQVWPIQNELKRGIPQQCVTLRNCLSLPRNGSVRLADKAWPVQGARSRKAARLAPQHLSAYGVIGQFLRAFGGHLWSFSGLL